MIAQVFGCLGCAGLRQVSRARAQDALNRRETPRDHAGVSQISNAHGEIEPLLHQVNFAIIEIEIKLNLRMPLQKRIDRGPDMHQAKAQG